MTQFEYEDYMYEDDESLDYMTFQVKTLDEDEFLKRLHEDAIASYYEILAEHYNCA